MKILSVTSVRDEGPFLLEWLAWHRLIGVTDFIICSNDCRDGTDRMLDALAKAGVVSHRPQSATPGKSIQWQALKSAWADPLRKSTDWMLISDVDEFPMIHVGAHRFADLIAALPAGADAVTLPWRLFGAAGQGDFLDRPVTQNFTRCAPPELCHPIASTFFKSLFRPQAFRRPGVHRPVQNPGVTPHWIDASGGALPAIYAGQDTRLSLVPRQARRALVELHHYSLRSAASFIVKADRGLPNRSEKRIDLHYWVERNFNNDVNEAALALAAPLLAEVAALKALPGVAELHEEACAWHREAFMQLIGKPGPYSLFAACLHAAGSAALSDRASHRLLALYQRVARNEGGAES